MAIATGCMYCQGRFVYLTEEAKEGFIFHWFTRPFANAAGPGTPDQMYVIVGDAKTGELHDLPINLVRVDTIIKEEHH